jgi:tRNA threonylcarbamoyl adenosine modification protein YjeE
MDFISHSAAETERFAQAMAARLKPGDVLFLGGDLGMGKSVFARALIRALTDEPGLDVPSPTFTLVQTYDTAKGPVWHFDLYRIKTPEEIWELGWEDALGEGIILVEWPSRLGNGLAPPDRLTLGFTANPQQPEQRVITITPFGAWERRWENR